MHLCKPFSLPSYKTQPTPMAFLLLSLLTNPFFFFFFFFDSIGRLLPQGLWISVPLPGVFFPSGTSLLKSLCLNEAFLGHPSKIAVPPQHFLSLFLVYCLYSWTVFVYFLSFLKEQKSYRDRDRDRNSFYLLCFIHCRIPIPRTIFDA